MKRINFLNIDGNLLRLLIYVAEEDSITIAAQKLGVTQSAVSHMLGKLRAIVGDPVVVKSGRGVVATAHAKMLSLKAQTLLDDMRSFAREGEFDPAIFNESITIAANDLQRDLLLPELFKRLKSEAPEITLRIIPSEVPTLEMLRDDTCHLAISPRPPDGTDIMQKRLFEDSYRVFYDGKQREAPKTLEEYQQAEHVTVGYSSTRRLEIDKALEKAGIERKFAVKVPGFSGIPPFISDSKMLTTLPNLLRGDLLKGLDSCELPVKCPPLPMYLIWHIRYQHDHVHRWLRGHMQAVSDSAISQNTN